MEKLRTMQTVQPISASLLHELSGIIIDVHITLFSNLNYVEFYLIIWQWWWEGKSIQLYTIILVFEVNWFNETLQYVCTGDQRFNQKRSKWKSNIAKLKCCPRAHSQPLSKPFLIKLNKTSAFKDSTANDKGNERIKENTNYGNSS